MSDKFPYENGVHYVDSQLVYFKDFPSVSIHYMDALTIKLTLSNPVDKSMLEHQLVLGHYEDGVDVSILTQADSFMDRVHTIDFPYLNLYPDQSRKYCYSSNHELNGLVHELVHSHAYTTEALNFYKNGIKDHLGRITPLWAAKCFDRRRNGTIVIAAPSYLYLFARYFEPTFGVLDHTLYRKAKLDKNDYEHHSSHGDHFWDLFMSRDWPKEWTSPQWCGTTKAMKVILRCKFLWRRWMRRVAYRKVVMQQRICAILVGGCDYIKSGLGEIMDRGMTDFSQSRLLPFVPPTNDISRAMGGSHQDAINVGMEELDVYERPRRRRKAAIKAFGEIDRCIAKEGESEDSD